MTANPLATQLITWLKTLPQQRRQSVTCDNLVLSACKAVEGGTEFAQHYRP
jgi:hypothetical protein